MIAKDIRDELGTDEDDFNIRPDEIEKKITKKTKAIIVVSVFGQSPKMNLIKKIANKLKVPFLDKIDYTCDQINLTCYAFNNIQIKSNRRCN